MKFSISGGMELRQSIKIPKSHYLASPVTL